MKLDKVLFAAVLSMCAMVLLLAMLPVIEGARGGAHPKIGAMQHGGSGTERHGDMLWAGWLFGVLAFFVFFTLMAFGGRRGDRLRGLGWRLLAVAAAATAAWTWVVLAYRDSLDSPSTELFLALPVPTAIMVYLFWPVTMVSMLCFVLGFKRWVLTEEGLEKFERLVAAKRERDEQAREHPDRPEER